MSFLRRGLESRAAGGYPAFNATVNPANMLYSQLSVMSTAGERVDEVTALGIASVLSCVSLLADSVATMPLLAYDERTGDPAPVPDALENPDPLETTGFEFRHTQMASMGLHGASYSFVSRSKSTKVLTAGIVVPSGTPIGYTQLHPYQIQVVPSKDYTGRTYLHLGKEIKREDLMVIRWMTMPQALTGLSPLSMQRTMLGLAIALDRYLSTYYANGGTPSGILSTDQPLTTEAARNLRESWETTTRKNRRPAVLSNGLKWQPVQTSAVDMEFTATRDAVIAEIGRVFRIPPYLLGTKSDGMTYQNVEQASINFLIHTLQPWLARLETAYSNQFPGLRIRFDPSSLLRLDALTRSRVQMTQIQSGTRTPNEARAVDGLPPYDGGDTFVQVLPGAPMQALNVPTGTDTDPATPAVADA